MIFIIHERSMQQIWKIVIGYCLKTGGDFLKTASKIVFHKSAKVTGAFTGKYYQKIVKS